MIKLLQMTLLEITKNINFFKNLTDKLVKSTVLVCIRGDGSILTVKDVFDKVSQMLST